MSGPDKSLCVDAGLSPLEQPRVLPFGMRRSEWIRWEKCIHTLERCGVDSANFSIVDEPLKQGPFVLRRASRLDVSPVTYTLHFFAIRHQK